MASEPHLARLLIGSVLLASSAACSKPAGPGHSSLEPEHAQLYAVNYPLAYFAERLAPEEAEVRLPVPPEVDPAHWKPSSEAVAEYQAAALILLNGAGYAAWTRYATLPRAKTVVTADGCRKSYIPAGERAVHRHGPGGDHAHGDTASTTWLDPSLALCQASRIRDALRRLYPKHGSAIETRFTVLEADLGRLDRQLRDAAVPLTGKPLFASHPVYQYLGEAYGLDIESFHFEPDLELDDEAIRALDARLATAPRRPMLMLWEGAPLPATERQLAARGVKVVVFEPLAQPPASGDFIDAMQRNIERLACAAKGERCR